MKPGDPSIFGRACEEIAAARASDIPVEIIPGITTASDAAASACQPLTQRGVTDRVVMATATEFSGDLPAGICDMARPGTTTVLYMAMRQLDALTERLMAAGVAANHEVTVAMNVSRPTEQRLQRTLTRMATVCRAFKMHTPAVIMLELSKTPVRQQQNSALFDELIPCCFLPFL